MIFERATILPHPYEKWISRVDICRSIQIMNDYVGGTSLGLQRDANGRVVRQAERNIYLPQPNWMALFGGKTIDVGKLEIIHYAGNYQEILWRTVTSANDSAEFDDGMVRFERTEGGQTRITIMARQKFALPLLWQVIDLDLAPQLKNPLVVDAYDNFFRKTIANFEAVFEGRNHRIGRSAPSLEGLSGDSERHRQLEWILRIFGSLLEKLGDDPSKLLSLFRARTATRNPEMHSVDDDGFRHFSGASGDDVEDVPGAQIWAEITTALNTSWTELVEAMRKDLGLPVDSARLGKHDERG